MGPQCAVDIFPGNVLNTTWVNGQPSLENTSL